jgi:hypothetical protein
MKAPVHTYAFEAEARLNNILEFSPYFKHSIKIANRSFEGVAKFKYLKTTLTDQN